MRRVLIVCSAFVPALTADMHRARMLVHDLPPCGWEAEILAPGLEYQRPDSVDPSGTALAPSDISIHVVRRTQSSFCDLLSIRSAGWRAFRRMRQKGAGLLGTRRFDLVYFSTTQFNFFCLGPLWKREFGIPYVLDFQDPWYKRQQKCTTTRHVWKYRITAALAKRLEAFAVREASGIIAVSPNYIEELRSRYTETHCLSASHVKTIPFGASLRDQAVLGDTSPMANVFPPGEFTIAYVGAGGQIMGRSFRRICELISQVKRNAPERLNGVRVRLFGTDGGWRPGGKTALQQIASEFALDSIIIESPERIFYSDAVRLITKAQGLLVLGVDDPAYMPSKLFGYASTNKPLLVCLHAKSQANSYFDQMPRLGELIHFGGIHRPAAYDRIITFLDAVRNGKSFDRSEELNPYLSPAAARQHAELFVRCLSS